MMMVNDEFYGLLKGFPARHFGVPPSSLGTVEVVETTDG